MTTLDVSTIMLAAAQLGPDSPLPPLLPASDLHATAVSDDAAAAIARNSVEGHVATTLPYTLKDDYSRTRSPKNFRVAVLENRFLRATFLLDLGGRLHSLIYLPTGRELLYRNPVFQPANLAVRNAWFSGGIEWNVGVIGHSPLTCEPLFAGMTRAPDGGAALRLWEWERIRRVVFQLDVWLPENSRFLQVHVTLHNPSTQATPMYWWSNAAVPERPDTRVVVPAWSAFHFGRERRLRRLRWPWLDGLDQSYPENHRHSGDFFFDMPSGQRRWIGTADHTGTGLIQVSTNKLYGRKLFVWGTSSGGRRWQSFLSEPGQAYFEIQSGLAATQLDYLSMPGGVTWSWQEVYGPIEADRAAVHSMDWERSVGEVQNYVTRWLPARAMQEELKVGQLLAATPPMELLHTGSGWGALEQLRSTSIGEKQLFTAATPFPSASMDERQKVWLTLLQTGRVGSADPAYPPSSYMVDAAWQRLLESAASNASANEWQAWLHLGIMFWADGQREDAVGAWKRSLALAENAWALRNLALAELEQGNGVEAVDYYLRALSLATPPQSLIVESCDAMLRAGQARRCFLYIHTLPSSLRSRGRIRFLEAQAAVASDDLEHARLIMTGGLVVEDLREGDTSLSDLWYTVHGSQLVRDAGGPIGNGASERARREPRLPEELDFRMYGD
jgi:tetratricopeptide (TPR) repeat protein